MDPPWEDGARAKQQKTMSSSQFPNNQDDQGEQSDQSNQREKLSAHDQNVLAQLFAPENMASPLYTFKSYAEHRKLEVVQLEAEAFGNIKHDHDRALGLLQRAKEVDPNDPSVYNNMAIIYRQVGDVANALACLDKAILLDNDPEILQRAYLQRALIHEQEGMGREVELDLERAAGHGSREAQERLKRANPYATMCSAIVMQAMDKYRL